MTHALRLYFPPAVVQRGKRMDSAFAGAWTGALPKAVLQFSFPAFAPLPISPYAPLALSDAAQRFMQSVLRALRTQHLLWQAWHLYFRQISQIQENIMATAKTPSKKPAAKAEAADAPAPASKAVAAPKAPAAKKSVASAAAKAEKPAAKAAAAKKEAAPKAPAAESGVKTAEKPAVKTAAKTTAKPAASAAAEAEKPAKKAAPAKPEAQAAALAAKPAAKKPASRSKAGSAKKAARPAPKTTLAPHAPWPHHFPTGAKP
ncbi:hypothetical protein [uncultured Ottowia sp.]|uniref:hypothetical protein n=1 Tax=uncultured Ottowia sp. TaxID=543067 RepID=UPI00259A2415|nr:hypothetical protein [uncultured Ottowia sp.]